MTRETLMAVLKQAECVQVSGNKAAVDEAYRLSVYVGMPSHHVLVEDVEAFAFDKEFVGLTTRETKTTFVAAYESVQAISHRPKDVSAARRTGFA